MCLRLFVTRRFDRGSGFPVVVIPGVQGRWEWMRPALDALARRCRTVAYSLCSIDRGATTGGSRLEEFAAQLDAVMDQVEIAAAAIVGVSFGGLVAAHYAATRPQRTNALIVASAPSPSWSPSAIQRGYMRRPWMSAPLFAAASVGTLSTEIATAIPDTLARLRFYARQAIYIASAPAFPGGIAARARMFGDENLAAECARITVPALVVTGEPALDRVIPVEATREYLQLIPGAQYAMMEGTGHLGFVTKPDRFAKLVGEFVGRHS